VIAMIINRPLGEDNIRLFGFDDPTELVIALVVDNGSGVNLAGKDGSRL